MTKRIMRALLPALVVIVLATVGYIALFDWSVSDSFYMTIITVGTVGFREVRELTPAGQLYTSFVIVAGVLAGGYALSRVFSVFVEYEYQGRLEARRMSKKIEELTGHTILAGMGRVGSAVAHTLADAGAPFVVVDQCEECIVAARESGWLCVQGDATEEEVLIKAGIRTAGSLITALDTDAENLFVTVTARDLNPGLFVVARSSHETTESKLLKAGASRVLTPNIIGGRRMATMVLHPTVSDYLDLVVHGTGLEFRLQEVELQSGSWLDGVSLAQGSVRERTGAYVLAVRHRDGRIDTSPNAQTVVHSGDHLVVLGTTEQVERLAKEA